MKSQESLFDFEQLKDRHVFELGYVYGPNLEVVTSNMFAEREQGFWASFYPLFVAATPLQTFQNLSP